MEISLKAPARPGLSLTLCVSAGTEPGRRVPALVNWSSAPADQLGAHDKSRPVARA